MFKHIEKYVYQGNDKEEFGIDFKIKDIFEIDREGESGRFDAWKDNENRRLLWHGSRLTNWVGIISQGLRIAPPEAPKVNFLFYFIFLLFIILFFYYLLFIIYYLLFIIYYLLFLYF